MKEQLRKIWKTIYVDYRKNKFEIMDKYDYISVLVDGYKTLNMKEEYEKYKELMDQYEILIGELDESVLQIKHRGDIFSWLHAEFANAIVKATNIDIERKISKNDKLNQEEYMKSCAIIYIFYEMMENGNEEDVDANVEIVHINNRIEYRIKDITLFIDYITNDNVDKLYHGTSLANAKSIIGMNKLLCRGMTNTKNNFHNKDKIFFAESLEDSKKYAERQNNNEDDINIIFEIDVVGLELYKRQHLLVSRDGDLYFLHDNDLDLTNRIFKIYAIQGDKISEVTKQDILDLDSDVFDEEAIKQIEELSALRTLVINAEETLKGMQQYTKDTILSIAERNNMTPKEVVDMFGIDDKVYRETFEPNKKKVKTFYKLSDHMDYLKDEGLYDIEKDNEVYLIKNGTKSMKENKVIYLLGDEKLNFNYFHGTNMSNAKKIIETGIIKSNKNEIDTIQYNKIFFSPIVEYVKPYGLLGGINVDYNLLNNSTKYIIFKCNPKEYDVYSYLEDREYTIWGDASTDIIENIYLCERNSILREISKEELLNL